MGMGFNAIALLESMSPYSSSRMHSEEKLPKEAHGAYDERTWMHKSHYDADGMCFIPMMGFKFALISGAAYIGERVPEKGMKTWTQYFTSAVIVENDLPLGVHYTKADSITLPCHSNGDRKSGKRVPRTFPIFKSWRGEVSFLILDETITKDIFTRVLQHAGAFIGLGRFRPQNGGFNGRFVVKKLAWKKPAEAA